MCECVFVCVGKLENMINPTAIYGYYKPHTHNQKTLLHSLTPSNLVESDVLHDLCYIHRIEAYAELQVDHVALAAVYLLKQALPFYISFTFSFRS